MKSLQIEGLYIRRAEPDDCSDIHEIYSNPKAFTETLLLPYPSLGDWRQRLTTAQGDGIYNLVAVVNERVVGLLGVHTFANRPRRRHAATIGMGVHADWQSRGVGTALMGACIDMADNWLNLLRLELEVFADNERAIRLYERFGFEREGTLRQHAFRDGRYVDSHIMARLRPAVDAT